MKIPLGLVRETLSSLLSLDHILDSKSGLFAVLVHYFFVFLLVLARLFSINLHARLKLFENLKHIIFRDVHGCIRLESLELFNVRLDEVFASWTFAA